MNVVSNRRLGMVAVLFWLPGALFAADAAPPDPTEKTAIGEVLEADARQGTVTIRTDAGPLQLQVTAGSRLELNQQPAPLERFRGSRVRAVYRARAEGNFLVSMKGPRPTAEQVRQRTEEALESMKDYSFQDREQYRKRLDKALSELDDQIDELKLKAQKAGKQAEERYPQLMADLRSMREKAAARAEKVREATPKVWDEMKKGIGAAVDDLQKAFDRAREYFR